MPGGDGGERREEPSRRAAIATTATSTRKVERRLQHRQRERLPLAGAHLQPVAHAPRCWPWAYRRTNGPRPTHPGYGAKVSYQREYSYFFTNRGFNPSQVYTEAMWQKTGEILPFLQ